MFRRRRPRRAAPSPRGRTENARALEQLGTRIDEAAPPPGPAGGRPGARTPNGDALARLGDEIDRGGSRRGGRRSHRRRRSRVRIVGYVTGALVLLVTGVAGAGYLYVNGKLDGLKAPLCDLGHADVCAKQVGSSFNVLVIGSDSRGGLPPSDDKFFGGPGQVSGQRSDVVKIFHVDPSAGTVSVISIPRDTVVSLLANQSLFGAENRINVNFQNGPGLLVRTIEANFGIPINHVVVVSFGGLVQAVNDVGGIWMYFPYPALDHYSSLHVPHTGCQRLGGFEALAVARSRHFYYYVQGQGWLYDGTSDFGRIDRQNQFLRALIDSVKSSKYNLGNLVHFVSDLPKGIQIDNTFDNNQLLGLAYDFRSFNSNNLAAYTLPVVGAYNPSIGDVLYVDQPAAQQLLVKLFGQVGTPGGLMRPTNPPPNQNGVVAPPPVVEVTHHAPPPRHHAGGHVTTTTQPLHTEPWYTFNPVACQPK